VIGTIRVLACKNKFLLVESSLETRNNLSVRRNIHSFLYNSKVNQKNSPLTLILSQINPVHTFQLYADPF
jgi:hypothetical protein